MRAYDPAAWVPFFTAMIAAAAGLTGLLFVAVSINLDRILKAARFLPARAAETLATLLLVVVSSALALIPQSTRLLGLEIVIVVVPMLVITVRSQLSHRRQNRDDLDPDSARVLDALPARGGAGTSTIAVEAGVDLDTVLRCLGRLAGHGFIERCDRGWRLRKP